MRDINILTYNIYTSPWITELDSIKKSIWNEFNTLGSSRLLPTTHPSFQTHIMIEIVNRLQNDSKFDIFIDARDYCQRVQDLLTYFSSKIIPDNEYEWFNYYLLTGDDKDRFFDSRVVMDYDLGL